ITGHKYGANALTVKRILGVKSYKTAWSWLHKLRRAMVRPDRDKLSGAVEVDETYVGGEEPGRRGRSAETKAIVATAVGIKGAGSGGARSGGIRNGRRATLASVVKDMIEPGSVVRTDAWTGYAKLGHIGYMHQVVSQSNCDDAGQVVMRGGHRVA